MNFEYGELFDSFFAMLNAIAEGIKVKYPDLPKLEVIYLDSLPDEESLPKGDCIFFSDWTLETSFEGERIDAIIGFAVVNDVNGSKVEGIYMDYLMSFLTNKGNTGNVLMPIYARNDLSITKGYFFFSPNIYTNAPRPSNSRVFRTLVVEAFSDIRLKRGQ